MKFHIFLLTAFLVIASGCNIPPKYWCNSLELAVKCNAVQQCRKNLPGSPATPVNVTLYYESYCPDCKRFITEQAFPAWRKLSGTGVLHLSVVPYGKATETRVNTGEYAFKCQHGAAECHYNAVENCIMARANIDRYLPVINCIESAQNLSMSAPICVGLAGMDWLDIERCASGAEGNALMHAAAILTEPLNLLSKHVPWIVLNGYDGETMQADAVEDFLEVVCDTYIGAKPKACRGKKQRNRVTFV